MKGIKLMLLGIAVLLAGLAFCTNNFFGYTAGAVGLLLAVFGFWSKES